MVVGLLLLLLGAGAVLLSLRTASVMPRLLGGNLPVDPRAFDRRDTTENNSPTVAANPRNPANLASVNRIDAPSLGCALHISMDGGTTWTPTPIPALPVSAASCLGPDLSWGPDGTLYISVTAFGSTPGGGPDPQGVFVVSSTDGGRTVSTPVEAEGPLAFGVRVLADPVTAGRLYLAWVQAGATTGAGFGTDHNPLLVARSDDGGHRWGRPVAVAPSSRRRPLVPAMAASATGALVVAYLDVGGDALDYLGAHQGAGGEPYDGLWTLAVARSADGGASWHDATADSGVVPTRRFVDLVAPGPAIAIDRSAGRVYVAFHDGRLGDPDVYLWASPDAGASWGAGVRVNDTPARDGRSQYLPAVQVAPNGRVDVVYYDRRSDPRDRFNEVSLQSSFDEGRTFTSRLQLSEGPFDSRIGLGSARGLPEMGSRLSLISTDSRVLAQWCDTRAGSRVLAKQDIGEAVAEFPEVSPPRALVRAGAAVVGVLGMLLVAGVVLRRRPRNRAEN